MVTRRRLAVLAFSALLATSACTASPSGAPSTTPSAGASDAPAPSCAPAAVATPSTAASGWARDIVYEVFVRSFADANGDGIGDLRGLTAHLDALNDGDPATTSDLGVTALWLMPVAKAASYHGYDVVDYTAIEPDYGTADDMRALVAAAHKRGIKVIVDFVPNHTSSHHPWFVDAQTPGSAHRDWYVWSPTDPGWPSVAGPAPWHPLGGAFYYGAFSDTMPDLNLRNPAVTAELERAARVWLDDYGVDGFRIDAAKHLIEDDGDHQTDTPETHAWLKAFRAAMQADRPSTFLVGEVWDARAVSASYAKDGSLDMAFDFGIGPAIVSGTAGDATTFLVNEAQLADRYAPGLAGTFLSNHDQTRIAAQLGGDRVAERLAAELLLTGPGVPFVYYGEELGMAADKPDPRLRAPYAWTAAGPGFGFTTGTPWEAFGDDAATANVATEAADPASLLSTYRALTRLRRAHPALADGALTRLDASDPHVAAVLRTSGDEQLLVISNLGSDPVAGVRLMGDATPLCGSAGAPEVLYPAGAAGATGPGPTLDTKGGVKDWSPLATIPAKTTLVLRLRP